MKKTIALFIAIILILSLLVSCKGKDNRPTDEEVLSLVEKASEKIVLYWNELDEGAIIKEFNGITVDIYDLINESFFRTDFEYNKAVEKYSEIFTGEALEIFLKQNFYNYNGTLYCRIYGGSGIGRENFSVEYKGKTDEKYNYIVKYDHVDTSADTGERFITPVTSECSIEKTENGYRISDTDLFILPINE